MGRLDLDDGHGPPVLVGVGRGGIGAGSGNGGRQAAAPVPRQRGEPAEMLRLVDTLLEATT